MVKDFGKKVVDVLSLWSKEDLETAYKEARERLNRPRDPITVKASFNNVGLLTISFNRPVIFPSYLLKPFRGAAVTEAAAKNETTTGEGRRLEEDAEIVHVFWPDPNFETNENSGVRPKPPPPPNLEASKTGSLMQTTEGTKEVVIGKDTNEKPKEEEKKKPPPRDDKKDGKDKPPPPECEKEQEGKECDEQNKREREEEER